MKMLLLISTIFLSSCGAFYPKDYVQSHKPYFNQSDHYFEKHKEEFKKDYYIETGKNVSISFPINFSYDIFFKDNPDSIGVCFYTGNYEPIEVLINERTWSQMTEECQDQLIYHELGHCLLKQDHRDDYISIMNATDEKCHIFYEHKDVLVRELIHKRQEDIDYLKLL